MTRRCFKSRALFVRMRIPLRGSIEQDADAVWFLYRDAYYNKESEEQNIAECIVAKNRHGETDTVKLAWDGAYTRFGNLEMYRNEE